MNVSLAEILVILLIALVVFGPKRLPEVARKAGGLLREMRQALADLRREVSEEYQEAADDFDALRRAIGPTPDDDQAEGGASGP